ncbi:hypothetical protein OG21DRAFT_913352 [Imleria badia]|nr:hypothetical protein OG21DRAFT_913352 [Imleria badia]
MELPFRLPTETLGTIFIYCARDYYSGVPIPIAPSWVNVSYVCRHWRNVALNCSTLWIYLFITSPRWTKELLARSKQVSLKLHMNHRHCGPWSFVEQVVDHLERIQELRLDLKRCDSRLLSKLSSPAPCLQKLVISMDDYPFECSYVPFNGDTPALRTLDIERSQVPWYSFKLSGLTTLRLYDVPSSFQRTVPELLATLSCMQDLTHLLLLNCLPCATGFLSSTAFNTFQKIYFPRLSCFFISARISTVIAFLSCVNIPLQTQVKLSCYVKHHTSFSLGHCAMLCAFLAQRFAMSEDQALSSPTIRSLVLATSGPERVAKLTFSASERNCESFLSLSHMEWRRNIPLQIILHFNQSNYRDNITTDICCSIPLSHVQSVHVLCPPLSLGFWSDILGRLQGVRYIKLGEGDMTNLALTLSGDRRTRTENQHADRGQILAPVLKELVLYNTPIFVSILTDVTDAENSVQSLCDALAIRKEPRGRLSMTRCTVLEFDRQQKHFDLEGWWEGGRFHVVDMKVDSDTR